MTGDPQSTRGSDRERRNRTRVLLVLGGLAAAAVLTWLVSALVVGDRSSVASAIVVLMALVAVVLLVLSQRRRESGFVAADPGTQREALAAVRTGHVPTPRIDAVARELAERQLRQRWLPWAAGALALFDIYLLIVDANRPISLMLLTAMALLFWAWWANRRRARRYLRASDAGQPDAGGADAPRPTAGGDGPPV
ncbi:hypothetical protein ACFFWC_11205 [Plantactinospora siamensis]|uniref:Integral membrane protein n=1 Tax=Plantactinospora siamensis TaxID=555372 RepID=A0ABV6P049_9ACTN